MTESGTAADGLTMMDPAPPDVLVSDIGMLGEDGYGLIRRARRRIDLGRFTPIRRIRIILHAGAFRRFADAIGSVRSSARRQEWKQ